MDNGVCTLMVNNYTFYKCCLNFCADPLQDSLDAPMPLIGIYIAAASALCLFIVLYDALNDLGTKRFWFPSKYFSLNSFTLTLLAIAMKLPVDLTGKMTGPADKLARTMSLVFMSTAMANLMTCLGSMGNNELLLNMVSLGILVITIAVNVCIHNVQLSSSHYDGAQVILITETVCIVVMILLLVTLVSFSIVVPYIKKEIQGKYNEISKSIEQVEWRDFNIDRLRKFVTGYWVMTRTASPQFVIARSVICVIPGVLCLLMASLTLLEIVCLLAFNVFQSVYLWSSSSYKWSTFGILTVQSIFVVFSTIAPAFRWFTAARLKSQKIGNKSLKDELLVETYWTEMLVNWKEGPLHSISRPLVAKKVAVKSRNLLLSFCCGVQIAIVCMSKLVLLISAIFTKIFLCCSYFPRESKDDAMDQDINDAAEKDINNYVLLLNDEGELSKRTLRNLRKTVEKMINLPKNKQPQHLIKLLEKSDNFNGVREFKIVYGPTSWSLRIVTLASIVIALPNIATDKSDQLLRSVSEALYFVTAIEIAVEREARNRISADGMNIAVAKARDAAEVTWEGIELQRRWQGIDIRKVSRNCSSYKDALRKLHDVAKEKRSDPRWTMADDEFLAAKYVSANEMYEISDAILKADKENNGQTEEQLFERLSVIISDIISACLTNLTYAITSMCHVSDIDDREESVRQAALLLGKSEEILKILQKRELPEMDEWESGYIHEWRNFMDKNI